MAEIDLQSAREATGYFGSWLAFRREHQRVPGIQAAFLLGDEVIFEGAYGLADQESGVELRGSHLFRIASHSKTFTATAIFQLVEQGKIRLDDTVGAWLAYLVEAASPLAAITIRELLAHGGGVVRDGADGDHWQLLQPFPDAQGLEQISLQPGVAVTTPNETFKYSNIGYGLLGAVIARASGQTYAAYVQEHILDVLALTGTGPELRPDRLPEFATGYSSLAYAPDRAPIEHVDTRAMAAATGFYSTARDLVTYFAGHFLGDERLLTDRSKRQMQQQQWQTSPSKDRDSAYALGLSLTQLGDRTLIGHGGGYPGHITSSLADPVDRFAVCVLTNSIDGPAQECVQAAVHLLDLALKSPRPEQDIDLTRFTGRFADLWGVVDVAVLGGRLWMLLPTDGNPAAEAIELVVVDENTLRMQGGSGYGSAGEPVVFTFLDDGRIGSMRGGSGVTRVPLSDFRLPSRVTVAGSRQPLRSRDAASAPPWSRT